MKMTDDSIGTRRGALPPPPLTQHYESEIVVESPVLSPNPNVEKHDFRGSKTADIISPPKFAFCTPQGWAISAPKPVRAPRQSKVGDTLSSVSTKSEQSKSLPTFTGPRLDTNFDQTKKHLQFPNN